jgi:transposase
MRLNRAVESLGMMTVNSWKPSTTSQSIASLGVHSPANLATGTVYGSGSGGSAARAYSKPSSNCWRNAARRRTWCNSSTARQRAPTSRPPGQKGAALSGIRPLARWFLDQIHLKTDLDGNPLDFHLTGGEVSDSTQFETSLDIGPDIRPRIAMTDKGYDSQTNRAAALARGITPVIPRRENSKQRGRFFPKRLYKLRARVEQAIGKLKRFKRVAMRCEKTDISYSAFISFACGLMLVKSVHTA